MKLSAVSNLQPSGRVTDSTQFLVSDLDRHLIRIAEVQSGEDLTVGILPVEDLESAFQVGAGAVLGWLHLRRIHRRVVPACREGIKPHIRRYCTRIKVKLCHVLLSS